MPRRLLVVTPGKIRRIKPVLTPSKIPMLPFLFKFERCKIVKGSIESDKIYSWDKISVRQCNNSPVFSGKLTHQIFGEKLPNDFLHCTTKCTYGLMFPFTCKTVCQKEALNNTVLDEE